MQVFDAVHGVDGSRSSSNCPLALHSVHSEDPTAAYVNAGQAVHGVVLSLSSSASPAGHSLHLGVLVSVSAGSHTVPAAHAVHGVLEFKS